MSLDDPTIKNEGTPTTTTVVETEPLDVFLARKKAEDEARQLSLAGANEELFAAAAADKVPVYSSIGVPRVDKEQIELDEHGGAAVVRAEEAGVDVDDLVEKGEPELPEVEE